MASFTKNDIFWPLISVYHPKNYSGFFSTGNTWQMVDIAIIYTSSSANSVAETKKKITENGKFSPKCPFFDLWPPYAVQKLFCSSPNGHHQKDDWYSNIIHQLQYIYCFLYIKNTQKMMNFAKNDLFWPLTSVYRPKNCSDFFQTDFKWKIIENAIPWYIWFFDKSIICGKKRV